MRAVQARDFMNTSVRTSEADEGSRSPCQVLAHAGMTQAVEPEVRSNTRWNGDFWVMRVGTFTGLDATDRQILSAWLDRSAATGIDTVLDLAIRPWNIAGASAIFGVFETNRDQASWLIVRYGSGWTLARCADGFISDVSASLPDILRLIDVQSIR